MVVTTMVMVDLKLSDRVKYLDVVFVLEHSYTQITKCMGQSLLLHRLPVEISQKFEPWCLVGRKSHSLC